MGINLEDEVLQVFLEESCEHLSEIEGDLLTLEREGANADEVLVNRIFRAVHTVKGGSGFFGFTKLGDLAHVMESLLDRIREREFVPDHDTVNLLLGGSDLLRRMVSEPKVMNEVDVREVKEKIETILHESLTGKEKVIQNEAVDIILEDGRTIFSVNKYDFRRAVKSEKGGCHFYLLEYDLIHDIEKKNLTPWDVIADLLQLTFFIDSKADVACMGTLREGLADSIPFYVLIATILDTDLICEVLNIDPARVYCVDENGTLSQEPLFRTVKTSDCYRMQSREPNDPDPEPEPANDKSANDTRKTSNVRVDVDLLDQLMSLAGELVLVRNQLVQSCTSCDSLEVKNAAQQVDHITSEIQEAVMATRMQRIGLVFSRFNRIVRDFSEKLQKKVHLVLKGEEVELDKSIIEAIGDPLTHLVRNSLDHGIESPKDREKLGKPVVGNLTIAARHEAGHVIINISDDGKGLDTKRIGEKILSSGLATPEQLDAMSETEINHFILQPGFSTAEKVTDISGRGVGMDVVHTNLKKLGGTLDIESRPGKGASFTIKLPLTLAIIPSLLVVCRDERFIIPQANLSQLLRFSGQSRQGVIENVDGNYVIRLRDTLLPLVFLRRVLEPETGIEECLHTNDVLNIAVVSGGNTRYGLVVDHFLDSAEIVVKPLEHYLQYIGIYSGATILGDGAVSLILDIAGIGSECLVGMEKSVDHESQKSGDSKKTVSDRQSLLVVQNGKNYFGILLGLVDRIERISAGQVEMVGNRRTIQYRNNSLLLISAGDVVHGADLLESDRYVVVIASVGGHEVGFIFNEIVDTLETNSKVDGETHKQQGVLGSLIIDAHTVLLLDLFEVAYARMPEWRGKTVAVFETHEPGQPESRQGVLILEDSKFFLTQLSRMVEEFGYTTFTAEDGIEGLAVLEEHRDEIGLVLTDIEMPRMDGVGFARAVRDDDRYAGLPLVAVTSVAGDEAERVGLEAGIDRYLIKLDRDEIFLACEDFLAYVL